jgi:hypothetical protein
MQCFIGNLEVSEGKIAHPNASLRLLKYRFDVLKAYILLSKVYLFLPDV